MLTGRPPFVGKTPLETLMATVSDEQRPRRLASDVDTDLETICLKCLDKDPLARYGSADAFADDLRRWLRLRQADPGPADIRSRAAGEMGPSSAAAGGFAGQHRRGRRGTSDPRRFSLAERRAAGTSSAGPRSRNKLAQVHGQQIDAKKELTMR